MTMVRDIELVQLLEDACAMLKELDVNPSDGVYDDSPAMVLARQRKELVEARLETEIRRRKVLR